MLHAVLRTQVLDANRDLARRGLAPFTFGNVSAIDRDASVVAIKPSGMAYDAMSAADVVVVRLDGEPVDGGRRPSSDLPTHLALYRAFARIGAVAHSHAHYATVWAQSGRDVPCLGTTHADYFHGPIPVVAHLTEAEIAEGYEANTGHGIARRFLDLDPERMPATLVANHGAFTWGVSAADAVETMAILEEVARLAYHTVTLNAAAEPIPDVLRDKHFYRKHGSAAYYGQPDAPKPGGRQT